MAAEETTVQARGKAGAVFTLRVPAEGSYSREMFDEQIAKGDLEIINEHKAPKTAPKPPPAV